MLLDKKSSGKAEALGRSRGGFTTKVHAAVDALGNPLKFTLTQGQRSDITQAKILIEGYEPEAFIGDKGYDSKPFLDELEDRGIEIVVPPRKNRKEQRDYDRNLYKDRNKVERFFNRIKHYRRIATRYDKSARNYLAFIHVAAIITLLL